MSGSENKAGIARTFTENRASALFDSNLSVNPFAQVFEKTPVKDIVPQDRKLVSLNSSDSIRAAVHVLGEHKILSAPVFDSKDNCLGSLDIFDIIDYISTAVPKAEKATDLDELDFDKFTLAQVLSHSKRKPLCPFFENNPLSVLVELFSTGVHRVILCKDSGEVTRTCSQTDVIQWMVKQFSSLNKEQADYANKTCKALGMGKSKVVSCHANDRVTDALKLLHSQASSVALVDDQGKLVGSFDGADCRGLYESHFRYLFSPIDQYLKARNPKSLKPHVVSLESKIRSVLTTLAEEHLHRVWIVDESGKPCNVISLTDIMVSLGSGETVNQRQTSGEITKVWRPPTLQTLVAPQGSSSSSQSHGSSLELPKDHTPATRRKSGSFS